MEALPVLLEGLGEYAQRGRASSYNKGGDLDGWWLRRRRWLHEFLEAIKYNGILNMYLSRYPSDEISTAISLSLMLLTYSLLSSDPDV